MAKIVIYEDNQKAVITGDLSITQGKPIVQEIEITDELATYIFKQPNVREAIERAIVDINANN